MNPIQGNVSIDAQNIMPIIKKWLYSDKDIFIREVVSNACDAITKLRMVDYKLAEGAGVRVEVDKAALALNAMKTPLSLSADSEDGAPTELPVPSPEEKLTERLALRQAIAALSAEDRDLIALRYFRHYTQQQTAQSLGTTQVQISRREKKILLRMRAMLV